MVLHSGPDGQLFAGGSTPRWQGEDFVLYGLWQFTVMSFSLCNTPATFKLLRETVLRSITYESCLMYLDDVIVIDHTFPDHPLNQQFKKALLSSLWRSANFFRRKYGISSILCHMRG
jgi:hypothetical protein